MAVIDIHNLTQEKIEALSDEEFAEARGRMALASIVHACKFLDVAFSNHPVTRDDLSTVLAVDKVLRELLTAHYPGRKW